MEDVRISSGQARGVERAGFSDCDARISTPVVLLSCGRASRPGAYN